MADKGKDLEMRISRIESMLESMVARSEAADISAEEVKAYRKVRDVIAADYGEFCGINDCFRCVISRCAQLCQIACLACRPCDVECVCGPCIRSGLGGNLNRFSALGQ
jgi:hypothetical protein